MPITSSGQSSAMAGCPTGTWLNQSRPPAAITRPRHDRLAALHQRTSRPATNGTSAIGADRAIIIAPARQGPRPSMPIRRNGRRISRTMKHTAVATGNSWIPMNRR